MRRISLLLNMLVFSLACNSQSVHAAPRLQHHQGAYQLEVLVDGATVPTFFHRGETYVMGKKGARYTLRIHNRSAKRVEAVTTVDGRDVLDGKEGGFHKRGYLIAPWSSIEIDGWRLSSAEVAAFRFSSVANSYAARTGSALHVGVIGVAIFPERFVEVMEPQEMPRQEYDREEYNVESEADGYSLAQPSASPKKSEAMAPPASAAGASADSAAPKMRAQRRSHRPGLGTAFGERVYSTVHEVSFERAHPSLAECVLGARYNDRQGLIAMGVQIERPDYRRETSRRRAAHPFPQSRGYAQPPLGWQDE